MADEAGAMTGRELADGIGRAVGGALIFGLPMVMTNELWKFGATMDRLKLALLLVFSVPLLVGLAHRVGFEATFGWREDLRDAAVALGVGFLASMLLLAIFGVLDTSLSGNASLGRLAVQMVPAAMGALLARSQFGSRADAETEAGKRAFSGYGGTLFMMLVGGLFLGLNIAPTDEVVEIAMAMTPWHALGLLVLSIAVMHAFVYGQGAGDTARRWWRNLLRYTMPGYAVALAVSAYVLWTFGRTDDLQAGFRVMIVIVLAFPTGLGAAAARLIL